MDKQKFLRIKKYSNHFNPQNKSCAVIFNGPTILRQKNGNTIDSHDYVVRFNMAPTQGYEHFVGSKTTHRILGGNHGKPYYFMEQNELVLRPNKPEIGAVNDTYFEKDYENHLNVNNGEYFDNYFITCPHGNWSNGIVGLLFSIKYFSNISLFGFNIDLDRDRYHYFDDLKNTEYCKEIMSAYDLPNPYDKIVSSTDIKTVYKNHNFIEEKNIVLRLAQDKQIHIKGFTP